jgi:hypothetical protein
MPICCQRAGVGGDDRVGDFAGPHRQVLDGDRLPAGVAGGFLGDQAGDVVDGDGVQRPAFDGVLGGAVGGSVLKGGDEGAGDVGDVHAVADLGAVAVHLDGGAGEGAARQGEGMILRTLLVP